MRASHWLPAITVDGDRLDLDGVTAVEVLQDVGAPGTFEVTADAWDPRADTYRFLDHLTEGAKITIGAYDLGGVARRELLGGHLTAIDLDLGGGRPPVVRLRGYDARHLLMRARQTRTFQDTTDSDAVRRIAREAGVSLGGASSRVRHPFLFQADQTDYEFIRERGAAIGFELVAAGDGLEFRPPPLGGGPVATLDAREQVLELSATISIKSQVDGATVHGWDMMNKAPIVGRTGVDDPPRFGGHITGPARARKAFGGATTELCDTPVASLAEAEQRARAALRDLALGHITAQVVAVGDPALVAGCVVALAGVGERLTGDYYLTTATHRFDLTRDRAYRTSLALRRIAS